MHDRQVAGYFGLAKTVGNLQLGIGIGASRSDGLKSAVVNPWMFYKSDEYEGLFTIERYSKAVNSHWFYRSYLFRKYGDYLVGAYGEKGIGIGPMAGLYFNKNTKLWLSIPVGSRPETGKMKALVGVAIEF